MPKTTPPGRGIADLSLLRTLLAIHQKSQESNFWEVMDSFVLLAYGTLAASKTLLRQLRPCLNFTLEADLSFWYKVISMNYRSSTRSWKLWRWMRLDLIFFMRDIYINSNLNSSTKFNSRSRSTKLKIYPLMEHLSNDHNGHPNQHQNSHKLCDETGHPIVNLMGSQWKLRQQHDQNFPIQRKAL